MDRLYDLRSLVRGPSPGEYVGAGGEGVTGPSSYRLFVEFVTCAIEGGRICAHPFYKGALGCFID